jgi:hypothetical protein
MWLDQRLAAFDGDTPGTERSKVLAYQAILLLIIGAEYWVRAIPRWDTLTPFFLVSVPLASLLCVAALHRRIRRPAFALVALAHGTVIVREFPAAGNHAYLELLLCLLCVLIDPDDADERRLFLRAVRYMVALIFVYSGIQKAVHGYYFQGQFLAHSLWVDSFRPVLALLMPADEYARLAAFSRAVGEGPYIVRSTFFVLLSNAVWIAEILLGVLLIVPRTRTLAVFASIAFVAGIEVAAREVFFGFVFVNSILLYLPGDVHRRLVVPMAVLLPLLIGILALAHAGIIPMVRYH